MDPSVIHYYHAQPGDLVAQNRFITGKYGHPLLVETLWSVLAQRQSALTGFRILDSGAILLRVHPRKQQRAVDLPTTVRETQLADAIEIAAAAQRTFSAVVTHLRGYTRARLLSDYHLQRLRGRRADDVHLFLDLGEDVEQRWYHLRAYTSHMAQHASVFRADQLFLTAYRTDIIARSGGQHALKQQWYPNDPRVIARAIGIGGILPIVAQKSCSKIPTFGRWPGLHDTQQL